MSYLKAIKAKCRSCMAEYADGKRDCGVTNCPLHPYMQYNPQKLIRQHKISPETRAKIVEGLKLARAAKAAKRSKIDDGDK